MEKGLEYLMIEHEGKKKLYSALYELENIKREVLIMHYYGGLKQREIADILGISGTNVRVLAHRGRMELKKLLEKEIRYDL